MNVVITGAAGLYGVHLADELVRGKDVSQVIGIDDFSREYFERDPFIKSEQFVKKFKLVEGKFYDLTSEEINAMDPDVVVHLAAYISIPESMEREEDYFKNNEYGTFRFMQTLVRTKKWPLIIYASSPEVYGNPIYTPMDINHPLLPRSIYAVTKLAAEKHCYAMYQWYGYPVVIMRNFNTFGENQDISGNAGVVSNFLVKALKGEPLVIHNRGEQTRDFQYVKDAVHAYALIITRGKELSGEIFNIGTGRQTSVSELAQMILNITSSSSEIIYQKGRAADLISLEADYSEIKKKTGWEPRYSLEEGLRRTAEWYRRYVK
jgi:UDP-glucose 4-epimerase